MAGFDLRQFKVDPPQDDWLYRLNAKAKPITDNSEPPQLGWAAKLVQKYAQNLPLQDRPSNERIFLESVGHNQRGTITEKDLNSAELAALKTIVHSKVANNIEATKGRFGYRDYAGVGGGANLGGPDSGKTPAGSVKTILGSAGYEINPLTTEAVVTDKYDFDPIPRLGLGPFATPNTVGVARWLGEQMFPPGKGRDVRISLGRLKE